MRKKKLEGGDSALEELQTVRKEVRGDHQEKGAGQVPTLLVQLLSSDEG